MSIFFSNIVILNNLPIVLSTIILIKETDICRVLYLGSSISRNDYCITVLVLLVHFEKFHIVLVLCAKISI